MKHKYFLGSPVLIPCCSLVSVLLGKKKRQSSREVGMRGGKGFPTG